MYDLNHLRFEKVQWLFPVVVTLHNLEEAVWLPGFSRNRSWHPPISTTEFRIAAGLLALFAYVLTYFSVRDGKKSVGAYVMAGFSATMLLNAIWHVAVTAFVQAYAPGVATAVFLILPVTIYLLRRALREGYLWAGSRPGVRPGNALPVVRRPRRNRGGGGQIVSMTAITRKSRLLVQPHSYFSFAFLVAVAVLAGEESSTIEIRRCVSL